MSNELFAQISSLIDDREGNLSRIEWTLTDGYARALSLEAERRRLEREIARLAAGLERGDVVSKAKELTTLAAQLDGNAGELTRLRGALGELRRHAAAVRS